MPRRRPNQVQSHTAGAGADPGANAIMQISGILKGLPEATIQRVLNYYWAKYGFVGSSEPQLMKTHAAGAGRGH